MGFSELRKYKTEDVERYINGYSVSHIEELEDDPKFMAAVCAYPCSKSSFYKLCSDNVKGNYNFVDTYITLFYDSCDMLLEVAYNYMKLNESKGIYDEKTAEILIRVSDCISRNTEYLRNNKEALKLLNRHIDKRFNSALEEYKSLYPDKTDLGFKYVCNKFNGNRYVYDYFANSIISKLFEDKDVRFNIHQIINSRPYENSNKEEIRITRELDENEIIALCTKVILDHDLDLKNYVSKNFIIYNGIITRIKNEMSRYKKFNNGNSLKYTNKNNL